MLIRFFRSIALAFLGGLEIFLRGRNRTQQPPRAAMQGSRFTERDLAKLVRLGREARELAHAMRIEESYEKVVEISRIFRHAGYDMPVMTPLDTHYGAGRQSPSSIHISTNDRTKGDRNAEHRDD